jgi:hypothetical protein
MMPALPPDKCTVLQVDPANHSFGVKPLELLPDDNPRIVAWSPSVRALAYIFFRTGGCRQFSSRALEPYDGLEDNRPPRQC